MYFNLPKSNERQQMILNKKASNSSIMSTNSTTNTVMAEERISEIIHNLDDHWGSPPILTPDTLAHILNHQWVATTEEQEHEIKKRVHSSAVASATATATKYNRYNTNLITRKDNTVISNLIKEFCKTIQRIDTDNKFEVTKDLKNDPVIQKYILSQQQQQASSSSAISTPAAIIKQDHQENENVLEHLIELLQYHNAES